MADVICRIPYQDAEYPFHPRDVTVGRLREYKQRYGPEYGQYSSFIQLFLAGDADAIACAISLVLRKAGINRPPDAIDYSPSDIFEAIAKANEEREKVEAEGDVKADPTADSEPETTIAGDETLTN